jgi:hypothetical protein
LQATIFYSDGEIDSTIKINLQNTGGKIMESDLLKLKSEKIVITWTENITSKEINAETGEEKTTYNSYRYHAILDPNGELISNTKVN